jgi:phenylalanyl-tRNA synthetase beta chain
MKFSLSWLKQYLTTTAEAQAIADTLNRIGFEVESLAHTGAGFENVVIGHIKERVQHPNADRLGVCQVDVGEGKLRQIVCGAPNARAGLTVAVALPGAVLPGDFAIKISKIREVESCGMICSQKELGLGTESNGIWEIENTKLQPGQPLTDLLGSDVIFDVSITPNRGDALSLYGIARDLAAAGVGAWTRFVAPKNAGQGKPDISVKIDTAGCKAFYGTSISGIKNTASHNWVQDHLKAVGTKIISAPVDATNEVMYSLGQPSHVYDADKIQGGIVVREAKTGESFVALDGNNYTLAAGDMVIADNSGVIGLAGIIGGMSTGVSDTTVNLFVESAQFDKTRIAKTGQRLGIITDARYRFERGIDQAMTGPAHAAVVAQITEICGGKVSETALVGDAAPAPREITFDAKLVRDFGGVEMTTDEVVRILEGLQYQVKRQGDVLQLTVPSHITLFDGVADVMEDILRIKGYDAIPATMPSVAASNIPGDQAAFDAEFKARKALAQQGYLETLTYSFISPAQAAAVGGQDASLVLSNPISADLSVMRPRLLPGLMAGAVANLSRAETVVALGEVGKAYLTTGEVLYACGLRAGLKQGRHWAAGSGKPDIFDVKADAQAVIEALGYDTSKMQFKPNGRPWYHPGKVGELVLQGQGVGHFGEVHPMVCKQLGLKGTAVTFAVNLTNLLKLERKAKPYAASPFQPVTRDFAFVVDADVAAGDVLQTLSGAGRELVKDAQIFDQYVGDKLPAGKKSIALSLTLQAADRTLTEEEINGVAEKAVAAVQKRFGAELRS